MPTFICITLDGEGRRQKSIIEAPNPTEAQLKARAQPGIVVALRAQTVLDQLAGLVSGQGRRKRLSFARLERFCQMLATYLKAGISIQEALHLMGEASSELEQLSSAVRRSLANGSPLDAALEATGHEFPAGFLSLVKAGMEAGRLDDILINEARRMRVLLDIRRDLLSSLVYPAALIIMSVVVILFMLVVIVPQVRAGMAEEVVANAPFLSRLIFDISEMLNSLANGWGMGLLLLLVAGVIAVWRFCGSVVSGAILRTPGIRRIGLSMAASSFCHSLGMMTGAGVRLEIAWRLSAATIRSDDTRRKLVAAGEAIIQGSPIAVAIARSGTMPGDVPSIIALGERTGTLPALLIEAAQFHSADALGRIRKLAGFVVPAIIVFSGLLVGGFAVAMMTTIQSVNQLYGN